MMTSFNRFLVYLVQSFVAALSAFLLANNAFSAAESSKFLTIDSVVRELILEPYSIARYGVAPNEGNAHYNVYLKAFPASKGRLARIDQQWQGSLVHNGQLYLIDHLADSEAELQRATSAAATARKLDQTFNFGACGAVSPQPSIPSEARSHQVAVADVLSKRTQINYDTHCSSTVDGICLVAELNLIFDNEFEAAFGSSYQDQAVAILRDVDFYFDEYLDIRFKQLRLGFGDGRFLDSSEVIDDIYTDMLTQRSNGSLTSIDPNPSSLLHFISGRDYFSNSGGTIGIAAFPSYSSYPTPDFPVLCSGAGVGTSQVFGSGTSRAALTAIIVAHELGHNFGFDHDGQSGSFSVSCNNSQSIMGPDIDGNESLFSSCSQDALVGNINAISNIEACFDFPANGSIAALSNPATLSSVAPFMMDYTVTLDRLSSINSTMAVEGDISNSDATFSAVTLNGSNCALSNGNQSYNCAYGSVAGPLALQASITPGADDVDLVTTLTYANSDIFDVDENDNEISETVRFVGAGLAPSNLTGSEGSFQITLSWRDRPTDETGYVVERQDADLNWVTLANLPSDSETYLDTGLDAETEYTYRVSAIFPDTSTLSTNILQINTSPPPLVRSVARAGGGTLTYWMWLLLGGFLVLRIYPFREAHRTP